MKAAATPQVEAAAATLWRCGGRTCGAAECDHDEEELHRHASGDGPRVAPEIVHEVLRSAGEPLPNGVRAEMETRLEHDFADVRIHTDVRAGQSAVAVEALAYTVGKHVVFAPGRFRPSTPEGHRLIAHELVHAASSPTGAPPPSGPLRISSPDDPAERRASESSHSSQAPDHSPNALMRQQAAVRLTGVRVNHSRVTVPPEATLRFEVSVTPANATPVQLSLVGDNATIATGTTLDPTTRVITVAADQSGGSAHVEANQSITTPTPGGGSVTQTSRQTFPFNFVAVPGVISSTSSATRGVAGQYGGDFTHTFTGGNAIERAHVNERFATATGTSLALNGAIFPNGATITVNDPSSATAGWDLDAGGTMVAADHVTWSHAGASARPFIRNASNPTPAAALPQAVDAAQAFHNLSFPSQTYAQTAAASTTHKRMFDLRNGSIKAVTRALPAGQTTPEVEEDYMGPPVFRNCVATPAAIEKSAPRGRGAPAANTVDVSVDREGAARPATTFSIQGAALGCTINSRTGRVTIGSTAGTIRVRAGDTSNFEETTVSITAPAPATPTPTTGSPTP